MANKKKKNTLKKTPKTIGPNKIIHILTGVINSVINIMLILLYIYHKTWAFRIVNII